MQRGLNFRNSYARIFRTGNDFRNTTRLYLSDLQPILQLLSTLNSDGKNSPYAYTNKYR